jgi:anti-sigma regulatory factor (Ser/Thr protein kinase)
VVALSLELSTPAASDMRWIRVEDPSAVAACRNIAQAMAGRLAFAPARIAEIALAVTEAASNLHKHAQQGAVLLRVNADSGQSCLDLVTIDSGPGFRDVGAALRDGHSTAGTLGIGLGAIHRLADTCDVFSVPGLGTALAAQFRALPGGAVPGCAGLIRPIAGEIECGDAFTVISTGSGVTGLMVDGLGHGPLAAEAAREATAAVLAAPDGSVSAGPAALLELVHRRLGRTRGGAVAIVQVAGQVARFAGLGNIAGWILSPDARSGMLSVPGIAGHQARTIRQFDYPVPPGAVIVLHSDGLSSRWDPRALAGLAARDPLLIAAALLATAGVHRDDAGILVLRP